MAKASSGKNEQHERSEEEAEQNALRHNLMSTSGVPTRHVNRTLAELLKNNEWNIAWLRATDILSNGNSVILTGTRGSGKTQLAAKMIQHFCLHLIRRCKFVSMQELMAIMRSPFSDGVETEMGVVRKFAEPWLLVIDDCHEMKKDSDFEANRLSLLVDLRYREMRPTVLVANWDSKKLDALFGASVIDRVNEGGGVIDFDWPSFRS
jgi:DNA replication protein DnaC